MAADTLVVLQPGYLPWLGSFDQMQRSSVFIYYDDVQFDKHGWRNRNRVKSPDEAPHWLTVPVLHSGRNWPAILEVEIDNRNAWARKHVGTLRQFYAKAPYLQRYLPALEELLERRWTLLLAMCQHTGVGRYLSGDSARDYLDTELFAQHGIEVEWQNYVHPVYPQQHGDFVPYLSIVDLVFNCGEESAAILGR